MIIRPLRIACGSKYFWRYGQPSIYQHLHLISSYGGLLRKRWFIRENPNLIAGWWLGVPPYDWGNTSIFQPACQPRSCTILATISGPLDPEWGCGVEALTSVGRGQCWSLGLPKPKKRSTLEPLEPLELAGLQSWNDGRLAWQNLWLKPRLFTSTGISWNFQVEPSLGM